VSGFDAYVDFLALKKHFTSNYDYKKYGGKLTRLKPETFEKRKDVHFFTKLGKRKDYHDFLLANLSRNPKLWITDIVGTESAEIRYIEWKKIVQSLSYIFEQEIKCLPDDMYEGIQRYRPGLLNAFLFSDISLETLCILQDLTQEVIAPPNNPVWEEINEQVANYTPFLSYNKTQMRSIAYRKFRHRIFLEKNKNS
jgi:hypothetical protein